MAWQKPKTDWIATDSFNLFDYGRITGNITALKDKAEKTFSVIELIPMDVKERYTDILYARNINVIENNVETLNQKTFNFDIGTKHLYEDNGFVPTFDEYNRIENACLKIYQSIIAQEGIAKHLSFTLGGMKPLGARVQYATDEIIAHRLEYRLGTANGGIR